jgi:hypothetical protein
MSKTPSQEQRAQKYAHHDWHLDELTEWDHGVIRSTAVKSFVETKKADNITVVIDAFMMYLVSKGYRIVKEKK